MANIALCLTGKSLEENISYLREYTDSIDLAELRLDCLDASLMTRGLLSSFVKASPVPLILTLRRPKDGGYADLSDRELSDILIDLVSAGFAYVDVEDDLPGDLGKKLEKAAGEQGARVIRSFHDFDGVPDNLTERVRGNSRDGALSKAAVTIGHSRDIIPFLKAAQALEGSEKILLAMGERGFFSRVLARRIGSFLSFTSPAGALSAAPGQIDPAALEHLYRFRKQKSDWPLYGIIGNPVIQSRSPELHNSWLEKRDLPGVYVPFLLDDMEDFDKIDGLLQFKGLSVTIPFKEKILPFLDRASDGVRAIGACNTFYRKNGEKWGENSDAPGFLYPLLDRLGIDRQAEKPLDGRKCLIVGAGGTSRSVLYSLVKAGAKVLVANRTAEKAKKLAAEFGVTATGLSPENLALLSEYSEIIVQTTSAGMAPQAGLDPLEFLSFKGHEFIYDIIYKPPVTPIMERARKSGCTVLGGWEMLREQGKVQFELFTGISVPEEEQIP